MFTLYGCILWLQIATCLIFCLDTFGHQAQLGFHLNIWHNYHHLYVCTSSSQFFVDSQSTLLDWKVSTQPFLARKRWFNRYIFLLGYFQNIWHNYCDSCAGIETSSLSKIHLFVPSSELVLKPRTINCLRTKSFKSIQFAIRSLCQTDWWYRIVNL